MTATPTAEQLKALVGPGQGDVFDQFMEDLSQQDAQIAAAEEGQGQRSEPVEEEPGEQLLAGKFKSTQDLEKAYKELESKLGQRATDKDSLPVEPEPQPLSREQAVGFYGESIVTAAEEAGIDLGAWDQAVKRGDDTAELREKLAAQTGIPAQLIEQYEAAFRPQAAPAAEATGLSDADVAELKAMVGGDEQFQQLSEWAKGNLAPEELADYNAAVDSGNKAAVKAFLWGMQARTSAPAGEGKKGEPKLISGGAPSSTDVFKSQAEAIEAMRKTNSKGQNLYRVDPKYRAWYEKTLARSTFE